MREEWIQTNLGSLLTRVRRPVKVLAGSVYPAVSVTKDGQGLGDKDPFVGGETNYSTLYEVRQGDVVVRTITAFESPVGVAQAKHDHSHVSQVFLTYEVREGVLPEFLGYTFQTPGFWWHMQNRAQGTVLRRKTISHEAFAGIPISLPPLRVQRRIVDVMAHLDGHLANLRAEREVGASLLAQLREALSAASDPVPLGELAAVDGIQIGPFGSQLHASDYVEVGIPVVMPRDITEGQISSSKIKQVAPETAARLSRHQLKPGDIVFPRRGDLSKRALVTAEQAKWLCGTGCIRFRPGPGVDGGQIFQALSGERATAWLVEHAVGTTMLNLNTQILNNLPVPDPRVGESPVAAACEALAGLLAALGAEESRLARGRGALLSSLLSRAQEIEATYDTLLPEAS